MLHANKQRCLHVADLSAGQGVSSSLVEANTKHRTVVSSQNKGFIDREAFSVLSPRRGKHVIRLGLLRSACHFWD